MEVWKDIKGYEGLYQISNTGRVKSLERYVNSKGGSKRIVRERILKQALNRGYLQVIMSSNGVHKVRTVHTLMGESFLSHTPNGHTLVIDHIDNIKTNNDLSNLQIVTHRENSTKDRIDPGVTLDKRCNKWRSRLSYKKKDYYIGRYNTKEEANLAYTNKKKELGINN